MCAQVSVLVVRQRSPSFPAVCNKGSAVSAACPFTSDCRSATGCQGRSNQDYTAPECCKSGHYLHLADVQQTVPPFNYKASAAAPRSFAGMHGQGLPWVLAAGQWQQWCSWIWARLAGGSPRHRATCPAWLVPSRCQGDRGETSARRCCIWLLMVESLPCKT